MKKNTAILNAKIEISLIQLQALMREHARQLLGAEEIAFVFYDREKHEITQQFGTPYDKSTVNYSLALALVIAADEIEVV